MDFLVGRSDLRRKSFAERLCRCADDGVLARIERFALTANNLTYAIHGETAEFWEFFPAGGGWGRVPAWGFAEIVASGCAPLGPGERIFGYFPMSSHLAMSPAKIGPAGFYDASPHRRHLSPVYNYYARVPGYPHLDLAYANEHLLLRPVFYASFLAHDMLCERDAGESLVVVTSASSKAAIGLAFLLSFLSGAQKRIIGLTSRTNLPFVNALRLYDRVLSYEDAQMLPREPTMVADFSGNAALLGRLHERLGRHLRLCCLIGQTHWSERQPVAGQEPPFVKLFAADRIRRRVRDWGAAAFDERYAAAFRSFAEFSRAWLRVREQTGAEALAATFDRLLANAVRPEEGNIHSLPV